MKNGFYALIFSLLLIGCKSDDDSLPENNKIINAIVPAI